jgi:hypothetical protein
MDDGTKAQPTVDAFKAEIARLEGQLQSALRDTKKAKALHLLTVTLNYATWLRDNGAGTTYSTFCDDFGYQPKSGEDRPALYRRVEEVLSIVGFPF